MIQNNIENGNWECAKETKITFISTATKTIESLKWLSIFKLDIDNLNENQILLKQAGYR